MRCSLVLLYSSTVKALNKTTCSLEGYNSYLNSKLRVHNSHQHLYKFITIVKKANLDRLDDINEFAHGRRKYEMDPLYKLRIETLQDLAKDYKECRKTDKEKLMYLDAIVSVQMYDYNDDPDMLDNPNSYTP